MLKENCIEWRNIAGYNGAYEISSNGEVRSRNRFVEVMGNGSRYVFGRTIKFKVNGDGYRFVSLSYKGKTKTHYLHRLVAETFIEKPAGNVEVNHINGRKSDNSVKNLEWVTHVENMQHAYRTGLCRNLGGSHYAARRVLDKSTGIVYPTVRDAASAVSLNYKTLSNMLNGWNQNKTTLAYVEERTKG